LSAYSLPPERNIVREIVKVYLEPTAPRLPGHRHDK